jgi:hypothetical protein
MIACDRACLHAALHFLYIKSKYMDDKIPAAACSTDDVVFFKTNKWTTGLEHNTISEACQRHAQFCGVALQYHWQ